MQGSFSCGQRTHLHAWLPYTMTVQLSTDSVYINCYIFINKLVLNYPPLFTDRLHTVVTPNWTGCTSCFTHILYTHTGPSLEILGHTISAAGWPPWPNTPPRSMIAPPPSGYQKIATFPWHGKVLPPFSSRLHPSLATIDWSPERQNKNTGVDRRGRGGFSVCKTPPRRRGATSAPCPLRWDFSTHWHLRFSHRRCYATKVRRPLASPWFHLIKA
jgi:hypothetical protein